MPTKMTLSESNEEGKNHHFYMHCYDADAVLLQIPNAWFEVSGNEIIVRIPICIWNEIARVGQIEVQEIGTGGGE